MKKHSRLAQKFLQHARRNELLKPGERVGVAVSGGADSVALLRLLLELRSELGVVLSVLHFDHQLRGAASEKDAKFVAALSAKYDLQLFAAAGDTSAYAREHKMTVEEAARSLRYGFFADQLALGELDKILSAHTLDDQAETVLMRLLRGAGTRGLAGILPEIRIAEESRGTILRPLLSFRRAELRDYLKSIRQPWREDRSNRDRTHTRNRIRHELLPLLERKFNPQIAQLLADTAEIARAEEEHAQSELARKIPAITQSGEIEVNEFRTESIAMQRRIVREVAKHSGITLEFEEAEAVRRLAREEAVSKPKRCQLRGGFALLARKEGRERLCFEETAPRNSKK